MAELADAADSKSADLRVLGVRLPLPAPAFKSILRDGLRVLVVLRCGRPEMSQESQAALDFIVLNAQRIQYFEVI